MPLDGATLAAVAALGMGAAVIGAVGGFGTGIILTAALVPLIGVKSVVPVLAVAGVIINAGRFWFYRSSVDLRTVALMTGVGLPFLAAGAWIYAALDARALGVLLGCVVLASVPLRRILARRQLRLNRAGLAAGAAVFGLASGFASGTGVILISLLLGAGMSGPAILATDALVTILLDAAKAALFGRFDLLNAGEAALGVALGVASIPGSWAGAWLVSRMGARLHIVVIEVLIVAGGVSMLWHALR